MAAGPADDQLLARAQTLAAELQTRALTLRIPARRRRQARVDRLLANPTGARLIFSLADRVLRPLDRPSAAGQLAALASGTLEGLSPWDASLLRLAGRLAPLAPFPVVPLVGARLRGETGPFIYPAEARPLARRLASLRAQGRRPNLNLLGEAVLGAREAGRRTAAILALLERPDVDCVSVKISAVAAGLSLVDFAGSLQRSCAPLRQLYRAAAASRPPKLVMLDMEEHRDLDLTLAVFRQALAGDALANLTAGIALQAYLPESHAALDEVLEFARERARAGAAPIRVRLVKGANLAMEQTLAELAGWPAAPYLTKAETDAAYKALLERLLHAAAEGCVQVGVATHNLFDVAFALVLAESLGTEAEIEMLAGMADDQAAAVAERTGHVLLYTPIVARRDYRNALAYLARRFDENATPEGFLHQARLLSPGSPAWAEQARRFANAVRDRHHVRTTSAQTQDRGAEAVGGGRGPAQERVFANEPPTDLTRAVNRRWVTGVLTAPRPPVPPQVGGGDGVDHAVAEAVAAADRWEALGTQRRGEFLLAAAAAMAAGRAEAIAAMVSEGGKTFEEADPEVDEAVDHARWYGAGPGSLAQLLREVDGEVGSRPLGPVVVAPPWNFPYAIPAGGVLAALAAGNPVLVKPAPQTPATCAIMARQLGAAGIGPPVLQLVLVADGETGRQLVAHPQLGAVVLTGAHETALRFARWAPRRRILAETNGKNAIVVAASADVDQAVRDIVASAFGHAGQKCSAASLAIVVAPIYDDGAFLRQLADAVRTLRVGSAADPATQVGPIVGPFTPALRRGLEQLDPGESWLVQPTQIHQGGTGPALWSPGVRLGVRPGSWAHMTEWFGPVLAVMRARNLAQALEWQNAVPFGLTAGLASLDPAEQRRWADAVEAGNLYINRTTTGAIVGRQPFGGWKRSSHGPTAKAGGPNTLIPLRRWSDPEGAAIPTAAARASYQSWWERHFSRQTELAGLRAEANVLRYRPFAPGVVVRAAAGVDDTQLEKAWVASALTGTPLRLSLATRRPHLERTGVQVVVESEAAFAAGLAALAGQRLRLLGPAAAEVYAAAAAAGLGVLDEPICSCGRIELVRWLREQVVTRSLHRYGDVVYERW